MNFLYSCAFFVLFFLSSYAYIGKEASLRFPKTSGKKYPVNTIRHWKVSSEYGTCIEFKLKGLNMEDSPECYRDYISVHDGESGYTKELLKICGNPRDLPKPIKSSCNKLYVSFVSDLNEDTGYGFEASVTVVACGAQQTPMSGGGYGQPPVGFQPKCGKPALPPVESGLLMPVRRVKRQESRIVGGSVSRSHSWPWQISIRYRSRHICGGSLVSPTAIVSAAHCFKGISTDPEDFQFWAGKHRKDDKEPGMEQRLYAKSIRIHSDYQKVNKHDSDLALIILDHPASFDRYVQPVCIPFNDTLAPAEGTACYVTGFGATKGTGGDEELKQAAVPIVETATCASMDSRLERLLTPRMVCAGYKEGKHDSCQGDSGGPLVCKIGPQDSWILSGVVSYGFGCAGESSPGVYVRTTQFLPWFQQNIPDLFH